MQAQLKRKETVRKLEKKHDLEHEHILSGIIKCPVCGAGMYGNISRTRKKDGTFYPTSYQYGCKHRLKIYGHKCDYRKTYGETKIDNAVAEIVKGLVTKPQFTEILKKKIDESVDVKELQLQVDNIEKQIRNQENTQKRLMEQQDNLDVSIPDYDKRYDDLSERIDRAYAKIYELNVEMDELDTRITNAQKDKLSASNIYYYLQAFGQLYDVMTDAEKKQMYSHLLKEVQIFEAPKENGQIIKSLKFTFPIDDTGRTEFCVDENLTVETVVLLSKGAKDPVDLCPARTEVERRMVDSRKVKVDFSLEDMDLSEFKGKATYEQIKAYVLEQTGLKVSSLYIAQIKKKCGLDVGENFNLAKLENVRQPQCTPEKEDAIMQAFRHFGII